MLILPLKPAVRYDVGEALAKWLDSDLQVSFTPANPLQFVLPKPEFRSAACHKDLIRLASLRNCLSDVFLKAQHSHKHALEDAALEDCYEYHATLLEFEKRGFPTIDDPHAGVLKLTWKSAWPPHKPETHGSLVWDRIAITYNIVGLLTSKAADCSPTDREECKQSVSYCQTGASLLAVLKELVASMDCVCVELCQPHLTFWERFLLAQAQGSIYRMAALASDTDTKHGTLAVLAQSSYHLYNEALTASQDPRLQSELAVEATNWGSCCKAVSMLQAAKAAYHQSVVHRLEHAWGLEIAWLKEAKTKLISCRDFCLSLENADGDTSYTRRECLAILPVVSDRFTEADKDNYKIYQETIPSKVPTLKSKQLAKSSATLPAYMLSPKKAVFVGL